MAVHTDTTASLARLEEWARHSESLQLRAEDDRAAMMKQLSELSDVTKRLVDEMTDVKTVTTMVKSVRARLAGGLIVLGIIGTIAWAGIQFFREEVLKFLTGT